MTVRELQVVRTETPSFNVLELVEQELKHKGIIHSTGQDAIRKMTGSKIVEELSTCQVLKTHDDGDLTLKCKDAKYIVTTDGKTFKEVKK